VPEAEWDRLAADIGKAGLYPVRMDAAELDQLSGDEEALDRLFRAEIAAQLQRWCDLAAERLDPSVRCIITPGNDDPVDADAVLAAHGRVECPELRSARCSTRWRTAGRSSSTCTARRTRQGSTTPPSSTPR